MNRMSNVLQSILGHFPNFKRSLILFLLHFSGLFLGYLGTKGSIKINLNSSTQCHREWGWYLKLCFEDEVSKMLRGSKCAKTVILMLIYFQLATKLTSHLTTYS